MIIKLEASPPRLQKYSFYLVAIMDFLKELTHDFGQNLEISSLLVCFWTKWALK